MLSANQLANPKYGVLYLPVLTLLYLWSIPIPTELVLFPQFLINDTLYLILAGIGFLGALLTQQFLTALFGQDGPEARPKFTTTSLKHLFAISLNIDPSEISESAMTSKYTMVTEILEQGTLRSSIRALILYFLVWFSTRLITLFAIILIAFYLWNGVFDIVLLLLMLGMTTIYFQQYVSKLFPEVHPPESAKYLDTPEYKRWEQALSDRED